VRVRLRRSKIVPSDRAAVRGDGARFCTNAQGVAAERPFDANDRSVAEAIMSPTTSS